MIIHLSQKRFDRIRSQGYALGSVSSHIEGIAAPTDTAYHLLDSEHAACVTCGEDRSSAVVDSSAGLGTLKELMRQGYEDMGDGWFRKGDVYSKYEDNNLTVIDLTGFRERLNANEVSIQNSPTQP